MAENPRFIVFGTKVAQNSGTRRTIAINEYFTSGHSQFMVKAPAEGRDLQFFILNFEIMHYLCMGIPTNRTTVLFLKITFNGNKLCKI